MDPGEGTDLLFEVLAHPLSGEAEGAGAVLSVLRDVTDLRRAGHLGVTVLADHHDVVCRQLAGPVEQRFDGIAHSVTPEGAVTLDDGLARFDCTIHREVDAGDHVLVLLRLHAVQHVDVAGTWSPLVFHRSSFGTMQPLG